MASEGRRRPDSAQRQERQPILFATGKARLLADPTDTDRPASQGQTLIEAKKLTQQQDHFDSVGIAIIAAEMAVLADRHGLAGLDTIGVVANAISQAGGGSNELFQQLPDDAKQALRQAGIAPPLSGDHEAVPSLELLVTIVYNEDFGAYEYSVDVRLAQPVTTEKGERVRAATWDKQTAGIAGKEEVAEAVRTKLKRLVGSFIKAWLAENPQGG